MAGGPSYGANTADADTAEIYDPATGRWSLTSNMSAKRLYGHTATLLPSGDVLVAGGWSLNDADGSSVVSDSSELFHPGSGTWTSVGNMGAQRSYHTATLMQDGRVLVAGGSSNGQNSLDSAEIYDPARGQWNHTDGLLTGVSMHTATLLSNGKVLVAGGVHSVSAWWLFVHLFDPVTASWTYTIDLVRATVEHRHSRRPTEIVRFFLSTGGDGSWGYPEPRCSTILSTGYLATHGQPASPFRGDHLDAAHERLSSRRGACCNFSDGSGSSGIETAEARRTRVTSREHVLSHDRQCFPTRRGTASTSSSRNSPV